MVPVRVIRPGACPGGIEAASTASGPGRRPPRPIAATSRARARSERETGPGINCVMAAHRPWRDPIAAERSDGRRREGPGPCDDINTMSFTTLLSIYVITVLGRFRTGAALSDNSDSERETRIPANPGCRPFESTVTRAHSRHAAARRGAAGRLGDPALSRFRPSHPSYSDIGPLAGLEGGRRVRPRPARSSNAARTPLSVCLSVCLSYCLPVSLLSFVFLCHSLSLASGEINTRSTPLPLSRQLARPRPS